MNSVQKMEVIVGVEEHQNFKMKKQIIILMVSILLALPLVIAVCDSDNEVDISDMPCEEITPIILN